MNPVPVMTLVDVIRGLATSDATTESVMDFSTDLGKTPVEVNDFPGFVSNRILGPMINEAVFALMEGVADVEAIDSVMKLGMNHPMGPLALADLIGAGHLPQHHGGAASGVGGRPLSALSAASKNTSPRVGWDARRGAASTRTLTDPVWGRPSSRG